MSLDPLIDLPEPHDALGPIPFTPTVPNALARAVELWGEQTFLLDDDRSLTFAEADRISARMAKGLVAMGHGKGARIAIMAPNSIDWMLCFLAISRMGGHVVAFSSMYQRREIAWGLRHNDVETLIVAARFGSADYQARIEEAAPGVAGQSSDAPLYLAEAPYLRRVLVFGGEPRGWALSGPGALFAAADAAPGITDEVLRGLEAAVSPACDMVTICTSGTTADPKAVVTTHGSGLRSIWGFTAHIFLSPGERLYCGMPYFWIGGFLRGILPGLFCGACLVYPKSLSGDDLVDMFVRHRVTNFYTVAGQRHALLTTAARRGVDLSFVNYGVEPLRDRRDGSEIPPARRGGGQLAMTETFGTHSTPALDLPTPEGKANTWGRPMPGVERRIVSLETGEALPPGETGELQIRSPNMMRGYYKKERSETFLPDGFFRTGDRCMIDADDFLYFYGRANDMIKTSGANVAPAEVEAVLFGGPGVREAIVLGVPDAMRGEAVAAVVVPQDGLEIDLAALREKVRAELSSYKVPLIMATMAWDEVPRTDAAGKPKRAVLREMILAGKLRAV